MGHAQDGQVQTSKLDLRAVPVCRSHSFEHDARGFSSDRLVAEYRMWRSLLCVNVPN